MPLAPIFALFLAAADSGPSISVVGHAWAPFISPMGEPFRAHTKADNTLALWFQQADRNHDGFLSSDEMVADADRFFAKLDTDHNGEIEPDELVAYEWDLAPEIQVNSKQRRLPSEPPERVKASDSDDGFLSEEPGRRPKGPRRDLEGGLQGGARYSLLNMPEPVAAADADFNRAISLTEFRQAAVQRFQLLDRLHQGRVTFEQLQALVPAPPKPGQKRARPDRSPDQRIGLPLPPGN